MGQICSSTEEQTKKGICKNTDVIKGQATQIAKKVITSVLSKLGLNFTPQEWENAHNTGSIDQQQEAVEEVAYDQPLGCDLKKMNSLPTDLKRCVLICCNTYTRPDYSLGVGPMNDALAVAGFMKQLGFDLYFCHNPTSDEFLDYFFHFLKATKEYLVVYYTGHGASVKDTNGDETDGYDEALVFDDNFVIDDKLAEIICKCGKPESSKVCLFSDCCHSGTIYDLKPGSSMPPNVFSLSAARDSETAKQTSVDGKDQGIFTFYFFKLLSQQPNLTPLTMEPIINQYLKKFDQHYVASATTPQILSEVVFT